MRAVRSDASVIKLRPAVAPRAGRNIEYRVLVVALFAILLAAGRNAAAQDQDTVYVSTGSAGGHARLGGEILDYRGSGLRIRVAGGHEKLIPAEKILGIETFYIRPHVDANRMFEVGKYGEAVPLYQNALDNNNEPRRWVRRQIMAQLIRCYDALGRPDRAGNGFVALVEEDPETPYFDCLPLAWLPRQASPATEQLARSWTQNKQPAVELLGLSYLLQTSVRQDVLSRLRQLAAGPDRRVAQLAMAQTWRASVATAKIPQLDAWNQAVEQMPERLAAGPYFVLGTAWIQKQQWEKAALALMRLPILYPQQRALAAQALVGAARCMEKLNRKSEALRLYYELMRTYKEQTWAIAEAESRIEQLQ